MSRVLLLATTTGYQTRAFGDAAQRRGVELLFATDRCDMLEDPWRDRAIPIRFHDLERSVRAILEAADSQPLDGVLVVGDRPVVIAAHVLEQLGMPGHPPEAAATAGNKLRTRERLREGQLPVPWFVSASITSDPRALAPSLRFPCVVKPLALSASRGVIRADDTDEFVAAFDRVGALLRSPDIRAERSDAHKMALVEGFIAGDEYALEGILHHGALHVLALFGKPEPLDGPFFEETIYVTPSTASSAGQRAIRETVARAAEIIGLRHGPIHAECRVNDQGVFVLEVAARPIGGLCARALRFDRDEILDSGSGIRNPQLESQITLEDLLLGHALGESPHGWAREQRASGVMMIPIPRRGVFRRAERIDEARMMAGIDDVVITAKPDQLLVPLPEGASYLGFIFAHGDSPSEVEQALRAAHTRLGFIVDPELPLLART